MSGFADLESSVASSLEKAGYRKGRDLLVHSAYSSVRKAAPGPDELIGALAEAVGPRGCLLFPALSYSYVTAANPVFDISLTRACVGFLPEYFRTHWAQARSMHPTHSVAGLGEGIEGMLARHELDNTPVGPNSPFSLLRESGGAILMLGCGLEPCTSMHGVEELAAAKLGSGAGGVDYLFGDEQDYRLVSADGASHLARYRTHGFAATIQRYDRMEDILGEGELVRFKLLGAEAWLIDAEALWAKALEAMLSSPRRFVSRDESVKARRLWPAWLSAPIEKLGAARRR
jgi:aminoglycoside 3-N-acetyltransferase